MKFLVFGAGVLGCNLANNLFRAGKDVTLLARGAWVEEIRSNGLRIKNSLSRRTAVSPVPVAAELSPEDAYDVIFVAVRYTQIETILENPAGESCENNHLCGQQCACFGNGGASAGEERAICLYQLRRTQRKQVCGLGRPP